MRISAPSTFRQRCTRVGEMREPPLGLEAPSPTRPWRRFLRRDPRLANDSRGVCWQASTSKALAGTRRRPRSVTSPTPTPLADAPSSACCRLARLELGRHDRLRHQEHPLPGRCRRSGGPGALAGLARPDALPPLVGYGRDRGAVRASRRSPVLGPALRLRSRSPGRRATHATFTTRASTPEAFLYNARIPSRSPSILMMLVQASPRRSTCRR